MSPSTCSPAYAEGDVHIGERRGKLRRRRKHFTIRAPRQTNTARPFTSITICGPRKRAFSGWVNPWCWVSKQDDWWQPRSERHTFHTRKGYEKRQQTMGLVIWVPLRLLRGARLPRRRRQRLNGDSVRMEGNRRTGILDPEMQETP